MTALNAAPTGQNTLVEPAPQAGRPGPVTLVLGANFAGVNPAAKSTGGGAKPAKHQHAAATGGTVAGGQPAPGGSVGTLQTRNAGASICSGLPPAYNPGG